MAGTSLSLALFPSSPSVISVLKASLYPLRAISLWLQPLLFPLLLRCCSSSAPLPPSSQFVLDCWQDIAGNGVLGNVANVLKALRIPIPASASQPAMPHGDTPASKPHIFPLVFASLPFLCLSFFFPRWHFQRLQMFKLHISASLRSLKAFHRF